MTQEAAALPFTAEELLTVVSDSYVESTICVADVECLVTELNGYQVVSFRGTEFTDMFEKRGWIDVIRDIRTWPWRHKHVGWGHAGFMKGAKGVVYKGLFGYLWRSKPVVVIGHSLGSGLAVNAALMLHGEGFDVRGVVGFGSPRALLKGSARKARGRSIPFWEYCNYGDPITNLPFSWWGFDHINKINIGDEGTEPSISDNHMIGAYFNNVKEMALI